MREVIDYINGETRIELSPEEIRYGFLSQCIEGVAEKEKANYIDILHRLEKADMTEGYILKCYEVLHTMSWENIVSDLVDLLRRKEACTIN